MTCKENIFGLIPNSIKESIFIIRLLTEETLFVNISLQEIINLFDSHKFELLLNALDKCRKDITIVYEILTIISNLMYYLNSISEDIIKVLIKYSSIIVELFSVCSLDEFRLIAIYYIKNLIVTSDGAILGTNTNSLNNIINFTNNNLLVETNLISKFISAFNSAKPFLKSDIISTIMEIINYSNSHQILIPEDIILQIVGFVGSILAIEISESNISAVNNYLKGGEIVFTDTLKLFANYLSQHICKEIITTALYNSGIVIATYRKLIELLPGIRVNIINYKRITQNNIVYLFSILSFACCSNQLILNLLINADGFLEIFNTGIEVFSSSSFFNPKIIEIITMSMFSIMTQQNYFFVIIASGILHKLKQFIWNNLNNISLNVSKLFLIVFPLKILYHFLGTLKNVLAINDVKYFGKINELEPIKLCISIMKGEINNLSSFTQVPVILLKETLDLLLLVIDSSIKLNIGDSISPAINSFIKNDGINLLHNLEGHPNDDEVAFLANKIINKYFKK